MMCFPTAALALLLAFGSLPAMAGSGGTRRSWELSQYTWIKRVPAEKGAPANGHPARAEAATLAQALGSVHFVSGAEAEPLFEPAEGDLLGKTLAEALSLTEPGEDLELVSTLKRGGRFLGLYSSVTARVFIAGGKLNLIVHDTRLDITAMNYFGPPMAQVECGSRSRASTVLLKAAGAESRRPDWLVLPLESSAPVVKATAVSAPVVAAPVVPIQAVPQPPPATSLEERLRSLKRLRDQNLITEEEYAKKKQELLKDI